MFRIIMRLPSHQLNAVLILVESHWLERAICVELHRLKHAVLGIVCTYYVGKVRYLSRDHHVDQCHLHQSHPLADNRVNKYVE